jgi:putative Holliday junction resolvase
LETLSAAKPAGVLDRISVLVREKQVERVVVGLPRNMDGTSGASANAALAFAASLRTRVPCAVVMWDERLTSVAAERVLQLAGRSARARRAVTDQVAAQMILQGYLDYLQLQAQGATPPDPAQAE